MENLAYNETNTGQICQFKHLIDEFCQKIKSLGHEINGYNNGDVHLYNRLPAEEKATSLSFLEKYIGIYNGAFEEQINPENEGRLLWHALSVMGYRATDDLFETIEEDDYIEVYNSENIQVHRSFNYFNLSSYSLEEIFVIPWYELYERDPKIEAQIINVVTKLFKGEITDTVYAGIKNHFLKEGFSSENRIYCASHNYFSPLKDKTGNVTAFVAISKAHLGTEEEYIQSRQLKH